jgi:hypothetical protein
MITFYGISSSMERFIFLIYTSKHARVLHGTYSLLHGACVNDNELAIFVKFDSSWLNLKSNNFQGPQ